MHSRTHGRSASLVVGKEHASLHVRAVEHVGMERECTGSSRALFHSTVDHGLSARGHGRWEEGKDSTTSRVEKRLCQGNCLEGVLQIKRGGRASCIIYGAQNKVKIWAACSKKKWCY